MIRAVPLLLLLIKNHVSDSRRLLEMVLVSNYTIILLTFCFDFFLLFFFFAGTSVTANGFYLDGDIVKTCTSPCSTGEFESISCTGTTNRVCSICGNGGAR